MFNIKNMLYQNKNWTLVLALGILKSTETLWSKVAEFLRASIVHSQDLQSFEYSDVRNILRHWINQITFKVLSCNSNNYLLVFNCPLGGVLIKSHKGNIFVESRPQSGKIIFFMILNSKHADNVCILRNSHWNWKKKANLQMPGFKD